ncbi:hypothetical protein FQR65_LT05418 [Abscondita terminalis]|nr:hypothetical protein FQR65_LT05418 [Abscondita terminalis]
MFCNIFNTLQTGKSEKGKENPDVNAAILPRPCKLKLPRNRSHEKCNHPTVLTAVPKLLYNLPTVLVIGTTAACRDELCRLTVDDVKDRGDWQSTAVAESYIEKTL